MPPLPPWEGMHPLVVHFPIALLFVTPLFILIGTLTGARSMMLSALLLMVIGVVGAWVSTNTGYAAYDVVEFNDLEVDGVDGYTLADEHGVKAELARNLFTGMAVLFAVLVFIPWGEKKGLRILANLVFLALWCYPMVVMADTAHEGGRLVHQFEGLAPMAETVDQEEDEYEEDYDDEDSEEEESEEEESEEEVEPVAGQAA